MKKARGCPINGGVRQSSELKLFEYIFVAKVRAMGQSLECHQRGDRSHEEAQECSVGVFRIATPGNYSSGLQIIK